MVSGDGGETGERKIAIRGFCECGILGFANGR